MNIEKARFNMIEQQIRPWNVLDKDVLDMLIVVKREEYFPEAQKSMAFFDTELPLPAGGTAMAPRVEARIMETLKPKKTDSVLLLGAASGYLAALLAHMARHVTVLEAKPELHELASKNLAKNHVHNVDLILTPDFNAKQLGSYDIVVIAGAVTEIPEHIKQRVNLGGRLMAFVGRAPAMETLLLTRNSEREWTSASLFETIVAPLSGVSLAEPFRF